MDLIEFIYESNKAETEEELLSTFLKFLNEFGLNRFLMADLSQDSDSNKSKNFGVLFNYPEEWVEYYRDNQYFNDDPVYNTAMKSRAPFTWQEVTKGRNVTEKGLLIMNEARENKLYNGVGLSIHQPLGEIIGMAFSGETEDVRTDRDALSMIYAGSNQFFNVYSDIIEVTDTVNRQVELTNREYEVLLWLSRGKTKSDISEILSISESTVKRHSESLLKKLDANNTPLAVVKALRMGLINPF